MKIALEATLAQDRPTGFGRYVINLLHAFARIDCGHEFLLLHANKEWHGPDFGPNFKPVSYYFFKQSAAIAFNLNRVLRREQADLFHATCTTGIPMFKSIPSVATVHDLYPLLYPENCRPANVMAFKLLIGWTIRNAEHFLCDSAFISADLQARYAIPPSRITVSHLATTTAPAESARARHGFLCVGAIEPRKNQLFLLEAFRRALVLNPELEPLTFIGPDRGDGLELQQRIAKYRLGDKVKYLEYISDSELTEHYLTAACLLFPTLYEGFGLPLLEAMLYKLPVLCSNLPVLQEVARDYPVYLSENDPEVWADAIAGYKTLIPEPDALAAVAAAILPQYSWDKCARETLAVYDQVMLR